MRVNAGDRTMTRPEVTLGILAGGRATRLDGLDKAWLLRGGVPQVLRWQRRFAAEVSRTLVSANRDLPRYADAGLEAVADRVAGDVGPLAGVDALLARCATSWKRSGKPRRLPSRKRRWRLRWLRTASATSRC